jgi:hypothetical protein
MGIFIDLDSSMDGDAANEVRSYGIQADVRTTGFNDQLRAGYFYAESNNTTEKTAELTGVQGSAIHDSSTTSGGVSNMYGVKGTVGVQDYGNIDNAYALHGMVTIANNRNADVEVLHAIYGEIQIDEESALNYGNMYGCRIVIDNNEGSTPVTSNQYLFYGDYQGTQDVDSYGIYCEGSQNTFTGTLSSGAITSTGKISGTELEGTSLDINGNADISGDLSGVGTLTATTLSVTNYGLVSGDIPNNAANTTGLASHATNLNATDDRDIAPEDLSYNDDLRIFFAEKSGIEGGTVGSDYQDLLVLNSYTDSSGGDANALAFDKNTFRILHYQADQADTNWGTAKQIAYTDEIPTDFVSAANGGTFGGDLEVSSGVGANGDSILSISADTDNSTNTSSPKLLLIQKGGTKTSLIEMDSSDRTHFSNADGHYFSGGNVGIGTTNPQVNLEVATTLSTALGTIRLRGPGGGKIQFRNATYPVGQISTTDTGVMTFFTGDGTSANTSSKVTILSNGNVGIGTTDPQQKLHIQGNIYLGPNNTNNFVHSGANLGLQADGEVKIVSDVNDTGGVGGSDIIFGYGSSTNTDSNKDFTEAELSTYPRVEVMRIDASTDRVGIGDPTPSYKLDVSGTIRATGDIIAYSDIRVKENIKTIENASDKVLKLRGVEYNKIGETKKSIGVIAQEIEEVIPEVVITDTDGMKSVAYGNITGVLIEAIKELKAEIEELKLNNCNCKK